MLIALLQPLFFHPTLLNLWQPLIFLHFYNCVISRILLKWNHAVCNSLRLALFTQHSSLEVIHVIACMNSSFLFIPQMVFHGIDVPKFIHLLEDI